MENQERELQGRENKEKTKGWNRGGGILCIWNRNRNRKRRGVGWEILPPCLNEMDLDRLGLFLTCWCLKSTPISKGRCICFESVWNRR